MAKKLTIQSYRKRPGTSGIKGQLYETKLLSLIYFRALHDEGIEEFHLATNVDEIGIFDDICLRAKLKDFDKPVAVFLQAKHRENDKLLTLANKNDLTSYFSSYLKIKRRFETSNEDVLFKGGFNETDCVFVMYTTAKDDGNTRHCEGSLITYLNNIMGTGNPGSQPSFTDTDIDLLYENVLTEQLITLAQKIAKFMFDDDQGQLMNDELVLQYHIILTQHVFDISDIQSDGHRIASLKKDFFSQTHPFLQILLFKDALYSEILERRKVDTTRTKSLLTLFPSNYENPNYLSELIGNGIRFKNGQLEFRDKMIPTNFKHNLDAINGTPSIIHEAVELAVRASIPSSIFNVPAVFGNKDLAIRGNDAKIEKRLDHLCTKLIDLIEKSKPNNIVTIDESVDVGLLRLNGGFASAIGNIFVFDITSKLFKFCKNCELLEKNATRFFTKLQSQIQNMDDYKFDMKIKSFPRLSFNRSEYDDQVVKDFFSKLVFYSNQGDENDVEDILKDEIESSEACVDEQRTNTEIKSEAIFLKYHDEVQKWWMIPKEGSYLTKESELYKNAVLSASQSLMGILNMIHKIKYKDYSFKEAAVSSLQMKDQDTRNAIITDNKALTVAKLLRSIENRDIVVLDMKCILDLPPRDYNILHKELMNADEAKTLIIVVDKIQNTTSIISKRLEKVALSLKDKKWIIVTVQSSVEVVKTYFSLTDNVIKDESNNLTDLNEELQNNIMENTKILFQGKEVRLSDVLDDVSKANVGGEVLYQILNKDRHILGKPIVDPNFSLEAYIVTVLAPVDATLKADIPLADESQNRRCFTRQVHQNQRIYFMELDFLRELTGDVTVIEGDPGMGKSTLLSQVSTILKQHHHSVWILRINLLEYSREFSEWQENKTVIDTLESLKFMCKVAVERSKLDNIKISLEASYYGITLKDCTGDEWTIFEMKMFLHFYNSERVVFLFDGFDEICPHYASEVLALIKALEEHPLKHKIWITSRSYDKIITILELQFDNLYEIAPWTHEESFRQLNRIWDWKKMLQNLNTDQLNNVYKFIEFMAETYKKEIEKKRNELQIQSKKAIPFSTIYFWFIKYLKVNLVSAPSEVKSSLKKLCDECEDTSENQVEFDASPLLLNLVSDYLYNKIRESDESPNKWYIDTNIFKVYESVLETKLKRIRFEEKNQIDMYKPDNILAYKKEYADFVASHKKMAAFAIFQKHREQLFDTKDINEFKPFFEMLREGIEKTGIICNVVNDIPIFVHSTFAEYFAVEFICDILQGCKKNRITIWNFILNIMFFNCNLDVLATFDAKVKLDTDLTKLIKEDEGCIFELLLEQSKTTEIKSSLCEAIRYDLRSLGNLLLLTTENNLNKDNLMDFIKIVTETKMLMIAIKMEYEEIILTIVEKVRMIDKTKLSVLLQRDDENIDELSTDDIIHELHKHVWTRMDIVPEWNNLDGLSGQIYFI